MTQYDKDTYKHENLFVYGILKRGFQLDLEKHQAQFIGLAAIEGASLRPIGGGVGLRFEKDVSQIAYGELFRVPTYLWPWLDYLENNGFTYTRKMVDVNVFAEDASIVEGVVPAWVYEHTYPGMAYASAIPGGCFEQDPPNISLKSDRDDYLFPEYEIGGDFEMGGEG